MMLMSYSHQRTFSLCFSSEHECTAKDVVDYGDGESIVEAALHCGRALLCSGLLSDTAPLAAKGKGSLHPLSRGSEPERVVRGSVPRRCDHHTVRHRWDLHFPTPELFTSG